MFNSLRPRQSAPSSKSSSSPTTPAATGVQHPLLGGSLSRRESLTEKEPSENKTTKALGDAAATSQTGTALGTNAPLPYKPRQRHSHSGSVTNVGASLVPAPPTASPTTPGGTKDHAAASVTTALTASYTHASAAPTGVKGNVTSRLQLQQLKAAAQRAGISAAPPLSMSGSQQSAKVSESGMLGMQMLETAFEKTQVVRKGERGEGKVGSTSRDWATVVDVLTTGKVSGSALPRRDVTNQIARARRLQE